MAARNIRSAYSLWPEHNARASFHRRGTEDEQVLLSPGPDRWPLWAVVGHLACQRVFALCDVAGESGAETTPFANAAYNCPGDDDLEHVLNPGDLVAALDSTFRIVDECLDTWTVDSLEEQITRARESEERIQTRGRILQRAFTHDISHICEVNETLGLAGLRQIDLWV